VRKHNRDGLGGRADDAYAMARSHPTNRIAIIQRGKVRADPIA
jgi:hypothetical protein